VSGAPIRVGATGAAVPEPGTALAGLAAVVVGMTRRRRQR
jgi:hypothetical protein